MNKLEILPKSYKTHGIVSEIYYYVVQIDGDINFIKPKDFHVEEFKDFVFLTSNRKFLLQCDESLKSLQIFDINFFTKEKLKKFDNFPIYKFHYSKNYSDVCNINTVIPFLKHKEYFKELFNSYPKINLDNYSELYKKFYNFDFVNIFSNLEKYPLLIDNEFVFSNYNLYNTFSRPTNVSNGINFNSISNDSKIRENIIPINDYFIEFDYSNYQMKLLGDFMGYEINKNFYEEMSHLYGVEERKEAKDKTLYYCYGEIKENPYPKNKFFKKLFELKEYLSEEGNIYESEIGGKSIELKGNSGDLARIMQIIETEKNTLVIEKINSFLETKKSKLSLYSYDAFLIDFSEDDGYDVFLKLKQIIEYNGETKVKWGYNYKNLTKIIL
jgi:hypothetical protein